MPAPETAWVPRSAAPNPAGAREQGEHTSQTHVNLIPQGDPFPRHRIYDSDFYMEGKPWVDPGHHVNFTTNIPGQQAIMERWFGFIGSKLRFRPGISQVKGRQNVALGNAVNIDRPAPITHGELATFYASPDPYPIPIPVGRLR